MVFPLAHPEAQNCSARVKNGGNARKLYEKTEETCAASGRIGKKSGKTASYTSADKVGKKQNF